MTPVHYTLIALALTVILLIIVRKKTYAFYVWLPFFLIISIPVIFIVIALFSEVSQPLAGAFGVGLFFWIALILLIIIAFVGYFSFPKHLPSGKNVLTIVVFLAITGVILTIIFKPFAQYNIDTLEGSVVDQDGKPVAGVTLEFIEWSVFDSEPSEMTTITKEDGSYSISFSKKNLKIVDILKEGYSREESAIEKSWFNRRYISNADYTPPSSQLRIYDISKKSNIIKISTSPFEYNPDGSDFYLVMETGEISNEKRNDADLVFTVGKIADSEWLVTFRAVEGGFWASNNFILYAPSEGYIKGFSSIYDFNNGQFVFYAKSQHGNHHSKIMVDLRRIKERGKERHTIQFHYVMNPTGNRLLFFEDDRRYKMNVREPYYFETRNLINRCSGNKCKSTLGWYFGHKRIYPIFSPKEIEQFLSHQRLNYAYYFSEQIYTPEEILIELGQNGKYIGNIIDNPATTVSSLKYLLKKETDTYIKQDIEREIEQKISKGNRLREFLISKKYFQN